MPALVPSPVITSRQPTNDPNDPNNIAREAVRLREQSAADTIYDPIPEKRIGEPFSDYIIPDKLATYMSVIGIALILVGICSRK